MGGHSGGLWEIRRTSVERQDTYETETIEDGLDDACSKGGAAKGGEIPRHRYMALEQRIVVDDHICAGGQRGGKAMKRDVHSSSFSTLFSIASAGLPKTARHTWVWMDMRAGRRRVSRFGVFEEDSARQTMSSRTRTPTRYPRVLSLCAVSARSGGDGRRGPALEIVYAADALLGVLDHL